MSESARSVLKHLYKEGRMTEEQYQKIDRNLKEPQWIPCSERLPEEDGKMYLVTSYCEQINRRRIHFSYCYANRDGYWSDVLIGYKVIAWMPLPKPYRKEGDMDG